MTFKRERLVPIREIVRIDLTSRQHGFSALHVATMEGKVDAVFLLTQIGGANPLLVDKVHTFSRVKRKEIKKPKKRSREEAGERERGRQ